MTDSNHRFDLQERTVLYTEKVVELCLGIRETAVTRPIISQLVRSSSSIGANYCEADNAETPKDFRHKIALCRKESSETMYWCRVLAKAIPDKKAAIREIWKEANELLLILSSIYRKSARS